jgi:predicted double-glycine peptidase
MRCSLVALVSLVLLIPAGVARGAAAPATDGAAAAPQPSAIGQWRAERMAERAREKTVPYYRDPERQVAVPLRSWKALKEQNIVMQRYDYSCGPASVATVVKYFWGDDVTEQQFLVAVLKMLTPEQFKDRVEKGLTMTDLRRAAVANGYLATMGRRTLAQMVELKIPVIVRIKTEEYEHFVVYRGIVDDRVFLADPVRGNIRIPIQQFAREWTDGVVLVVVKPDTPPPEDAPLSRLPRPPAQTEMQSARSVLFRAPAVDFRRPPLPH